ncbi:MAG: hypothetical protein H6721_18470 [Sandaracinus sp.]|nr:hypothetical protein [Sandaracinus sp.]
MNVSRDAKAPIGLVSVVREGVTDLELLADETGTTRLQLRHGGRYVQNLYGVGVRVGGDPHLAVTLGLGVRLFELRRVTLDLDATVGWLWRP